MTERPKLIEDVEYTQGCWVEFQKARIAGGVSVEVDNWEGGLGAVVNEQIVGVTGYVQYGIPYLQGRLQLDYLITQSWRPQLSVGVPFRIEDFKIEPHLSVHVVAGSIAPKIGLRMQYLF